MKIHKALSIILVLALVFAAGCVNKTVISNEPEDTLEGKIVIWGNKNSIEALKLSAHNFSKLHAKVSIDFIEVDKDKLEEKLNACIDLKANIPDIIAVEDEQVQSIIKDFKDNLKETGSSIKKEEYLKYKIKNLSLENKLYGIPFNSEPAVMLYRSDIFLKAGANAEYIKTYRDFIDKGKSIVKFTGKKMIAYSLEDDEVYRRMLNQLNQSYFDEDGKPLLNTPSAHRVLENLKIFQEEELVQRVGPSENIINIVKAEKAAAVIASPEDVFRVMKELTQFKGKLDIMKVPAFEEGGNQSISLGGTNLMLLKSDIDENLLLEFAKFTTENKDNITSLISSTGFFPAYSYFYDEKWFQQGGNILYSQLAKDIYTFNYTENFSKVVQSVQNAIGKIILAGEDINITMEALQKETEEIMKPEETLP